MKTYKMAKIVYFKKDKEFSASNDGGVSGYMDEAILYDIDMPDETIISFFDDDYQDQIEIWKVRLTIETLVDLKE